MRLTPLAAAIFAADLVLAVLIANWVPKGLDRRSLRRDAEAALKAYFEGEAERVLADTPNRRLREAAAAWERVLKRRPGYAAGRLGIAKCKADEGDLEGARTAYERAAAAKGASAREIAISRCGLAVVLVRAADAGDPAAAALEGRVLSLLAESQSGDPRSADPCVALAVLGLRKGNRTEAEKWIAEAERRGLVLSKEGIAPFLLARGILKTGPEAEADVEASLLVNPKSAAARRNLDQQAILRLASGEGDFGKDVETVRGLPYVRAFLEGKPPDPATRTNLLSALNALGLAAHRAGLAALAEADRAGPNAEDPAVRARARAEEDRAVRLLSDALARFDEGARLAGGGLFVPNQAAAATALERAAARVAARGGDDARKAAGSADGAARARLAALERILEARLARAGRSPEDAARAEETALTVAALRLARNDSAGAATAVERLPLPERPDALRARGILAYLEGRHGDARDLWRKAREALAKGKPDGWTHPEIDPILRALSEPPRVGEISAPGGLARPAGGGEVFPTRYAFRVPVENRAAATPLEESQIQVAVDGRPLEFVLTARHVYSRALEGLAHGLHKVSVRVRDALGNEANRSFDFRVDAEAPRVALKVPQPDRVFDAKTAKFYNTEEIPIEFSIRDDDLPLDPSSIQCEVQPVPEQGPAPPAWKLVVDGVVKHRGQRSDPEFDRPLPAEGGDPRTARMHFEPRRPAMTWGTYTVRVQARDRFGNGMHDSWSFKVIGRSPIPSPAPEPERPKDGVEPPP